MFIGSSYGIAVCLYYKIFHGNIPSNAKQIFLQSKTTRNRSETKLFTDRSGKAVGVKRAHPTYQEENCKTIWDSWNSCRFRRNTNGIYFFLVRPQLDVCGAEAKGL